MKEDLTNQTVKRFQDLLGEVQWIKSAVFRRNFRHGGRIFDVVADVQVPQGRLRLVTEVKQRVLRPVDVPIAAMQLRRSVENMIEKGLTVHPLLACPWVSPRVAAEYAKEGIGWFDLAGNCHLSFPGVHIHREGIPNPFQQPERKVAWSSPAAKRLLHLLLEPVHTGRNWKQRELQAVCGGQVSLGLVNKVARRLIEEAYALEGTDGFQLNRPAELLREWARSQKPEVINRQGWHTLMHGITLEAALRKLFAMPGMNRRLLLSSFTSAKYLAPFVRTATLYLYADEQAQHEVKSTLLLTPATEGENVLIEIPANEVIFTGCLEVAPGLWATDMVQTYLDLWASGERGQEAAEHLLTQKLIPAWEGAV